MSLTESDNRNRPSSSPSSSKVGGKFGCGRHHGDGGDQDESSSADDHDGGGFRSNKNKRRGYGCAGVVVTLPFVKAKKLIKNKSDKRPCSSSSSSNGVSGQSCLCLKQTFQLASPAKSHISDPNDPNFTFEMLRTFIEKNDFYSKNCNTHLDVCDSSCNHFERK